MSIPREHLEFEIQRAIANRRTIEAIKLYRELHGVGLKEAKDAVDAMSRGQAPASRTVHDADEQQVYNALFAGNKIEAIRIWRQISGNGLKESKDFIDALELDLRTETPEKFAAAPRRLGCAGVLVVLAIGAAAITWRFI
jgi:ribosomal protein L7/L12